MKNVLFYFLIAWRCTFYLHAQVDSIATISSLPPQNDSIIYSADFTLREGVYLSYSDFRKNSPLLKENIISNEDKTQLDFISKTLNNNQEFIFKLNGTTYKAPSTKVWGYCQNGTVYINFQKNFYRVPVFGNISQFFGTVEVVNYVSSGGYYGGYYGMGMMGMGGPTVPVKQKETRQFILEFYTGDIIECTPHNLETILSHDMKLYQQYMGLRRKQRKELMILYIRKYNEAHPIYFPAKVN